MCYPHTFPPPPAHTRPAHTLHAPYTRPARRLHATPSNLATLPLPYHLLQVALAASAGSLIVWHSLLPHGPAPNLGTAPRVSSYVTMLPVRAPHVHRMCMCMCMCMACACACACALHVHRMCIACASHVHSMCTACAPRVHRMRNTYTCTSSRPTSPGRRRAFPRRRPTPRHATEHV